jgi:WD40 repeat protein
MKFKKRYTLKTRLAKAKARRQRGGGFMDAIGVLKDVEGRHNTTMAVHPHQPLIAVGDDAGGVTVWEINPSGSVPKLLAHLIGLPSAAVKCVEFHPTLPVLAAACSDRVLMWRVDKISGRQLEPSHISGELDEVSCFSFHPTQPYIAVGVNNSGGRNRIDMHGFNMESSSFEVVFQLSTRLPIDDVRRHPEVLMTSFSRDGSMFAFVTKSLDGSTVVKVQAVKSRYEPSECANYRIDRAVTCIAPYKTTGSYHDGSFYKFSGPMKTHEFIIGCDDGSLIRIEAVTIDLVGMRLTRVETVRSVRGNEWNAGAAIVCVAVHPSLPLFASGSRDGTVQLWNMGIADRGSIESLQVHQVRSVGFNQHFSAVCGSGVTTVYGCNPDDLLSSETKTDKFAGELMLENRQGKCSICLDSMNDPLMQSALRSGPEDAREVYLECGHKFHKKCMGSWKGKCPLCRAETKLAGPGTPRGVIVSREQFRREQAATAAASAGETISERNKRFSSLSKKSKKGKDNDSKGGRKKNKSKKQKLRNN